MIGRIDESKRKAVVISGGISGLLASYHLSKRGFHVTLYEKEPRLGGLIQTRQTSYGPAEAAAHSLIGSPAVQRLFEDLGVPFVSVEKNSRAKFIYRGGRVRRFPLGVLTALRAFLRAYFVLAPSGKDPNKLSLEEWGNRFLGPEFVEYMLNPFLRGIYAARPSEITVGAAFPALAVPRGHSLLSHLMRRRLKRDRSAVSGKRESSELRSERKSTDRKNLGHEEVGHKKIGRKKNEMISPSGGMEALVRALSHQLETSPNVELRLGTAITSFEELPEREESNIVLCAPAHSSAELLGRDFSVSAQALSEISYAPLVSVTAFIKAKPKALPPCGVGVLFPEREHQDCLGILFNSRAFPGRVAGEANTPLSSDAATTPLTSDDHLVVSCTFMLGGTSGPEWLEAPDEKVLDSCRRQYGQLVKSENFEIIETVIHRWRDAIPLYSEKLVEAQEIVGADWCQRSGRVLFGNYTGQVSVRGMIESAEEHFGTPGPNPGDE